MKQERQPEHQINPKQAERLFAKAATFAQQHGAHLTRKDVDTSWYAPHTGELCIGSRLSPQEAVDRIVYETAMLLNNVNHTLPLAERLSFEQRRRIAAATTRDVLRRYGPWERTTRPTDQEIATYYRTAWEDPTACDRMLDEQTRVWETTERIRAALDARKRVRSGRKKKLVRLDRSWDPAIDPSGALIRVPKPGVKEWPATRVTITKRGYSTLVYEAMECDRRGEYHWFRVSDGQPQQHPSTPSDPAERAAGTGHEDECPF